MDRLRAALGPAALLLYAALFFSALQLASPHLVDRDSYFHARYAALLPERGLARDFPWARGTIIGERFSDKELLFHVFLAPFCALDPVGGAKVAVVALDVAIVAATWLALRSIGARAPALFAALLLAGGNHFLFRLAMARPHLGSIALAVAGAAALLGQRRGLAFAIGLAWSWAYAAPQLFLGLGLLEWAGRLVAGAEDRSPRALVAAAGGIAAGLLFHPYFPNDVLLFRAQNWTVLAQAWGLAPDLGVRLGAEFQPITTRSLLVTSAGSLAALLGGTLAALAAPARPSPRTVSLFLMAAGALALALLSAKLVEYLAPMAVLFAASAATDALAGAAPRRALAAGLVAAGVLLHALGGFLAYGAVRATPPPALEGAARHIAATAKPGEVVAHLSWADFSTLFFFAPRQRYLVAMDPTFLALADPEGARLLEDLREGRRLFEGKEIARHFGARLLAIDATREGPYEAAVRAGLEIVYEDGKGAVFALPAPD